MIKKVEKAWGFEEWWVNEPEYCFKILVVKPGFQSSKHYHCNKKETFLALRGRCVLRVWDRASNSLAIHTLESEKQVTILPGQPHQFYLEANATEPCVIYEISTHHDDADVVRQSVSGPL